MSQFGVKNYCSPLAFNTYELETLIFLPLLPETEVFTFWVQHSPRDAREKKLPGPLNSPANTEKSWWSITHCSTLTQGEGKCKGHANRPNSSSNVDVIVYLLQFSSHESKMKTRFDHLTVLSFCCQHAAKASNKQTEFVEQNIKTNT